MFFISDEQIQEAFDELHSGEHAKTRAAYEHHEKRLKIILARAVLNADGRTVGEREAQAMTSPEYEAAVATSQLLAELYHAARDRRDAANAVAEAWRTQQSDRRAMRNVA